MVRKPRPFINGSGSPTGEPVYLTVGFIRRPHGTRGEAIMDIHTEFPDRLRKSVQVFVGEQHQPLILASSRTHGNAILVSFVGLDSPEKVGILRNSWVYVASIDRPPLPGGKIYRHQILGCSVITDDNEMLGELVDVFETGANNIYVVKTKENRELLLPAIPDVVLNINLDTKEMIVHIINGLLD